MTNSDEMPNYDEDAVKPMRDELVRVGFQELRSAQAVDELFSAQSGTTLVVLNSVCGCAAGGARPGASLALQHDKIPDRLATVFAGQDKAAVRQFRSKLNVPPSSPFIALFKDGKPVKVMQRHDIEGKDAGRIAGELAAAFDQFCARSGPSIPRDEFEKMVGVKACGSKIPPHTVKIQGIESAPQRPQADAAAPEGDDKKGWWKLFK
jgi:putative YphP/YqiW family bacilliredoxin